ncbi:MAG: PEP-CTERM sorting domain-containing protein [Planctomycetaceae bacterium]|jgi:hypothetical protein|nr:PEP-CTERM sorting domain-containing protein [Planctomycetaceae bacterium]
MKTLTTKTLSLAIAALFVIGAANTAQAGYVDDGWSISVSAAITDFAAPKYDTKGSFSDHVSLAGDRWADGQARYGKWSNGKATGTDQKSASFYGIFRDSESKISWGKFVTNSKGQESSRVASSLEIKGNTINNYQVGSTATAATLIHSNANLGDAVSSLVTHKDSYMSNQDNQLITPDSFKLALNFQITNSYDASWSENITLDFSTDFWETFNKVGGKWVTDHVGFEDDIFFFQDPIESFYKEFVFNDETYYVSVTTTFSELTGQYYDEAAKILGVDNNAPIYGWVTAEGKQTPNQFDISFSIMQKPPEEIGGSDVITPEPATMLVFGFGLAGLGWMRRRKITPAG